jgi:hypothetical protein
MFLSLGTHLSQSRHHLKSEDGFDQQFQKQKLKEKRLKRKLQENEMKKHPRQVGVYEKKIHS